MNDGNFTDGFYSNTSNSFFRHETDDKNVDSEEKLEFESQ